MAAAGLAFGGAASRIGPCFGMVVQPGERDGVQCSVQLPIAATVEPVSHGLAAGGRDGCDTSQSGERCVVADAARVATTRPGIGRR